MTIKFTLFRKNYEMEAKTATVTFNGKTFKVAFPAIPDPSWSLKLGSGHAPLFYDDLSAVLGSYRRTCGRKEIFQVLIDVESESIVTDIWDMKKGMYRLQEIVPTRLNAGATLFK